MPARDITDELPARADWPRLFDLKRKWQVSLGALLMRARALDRMSDNQYLTAVKAASARGWRRVEPVPLGRPEEPTRLQHLLATPAARRAAAALPADILDALLAATEIQLRSIERRATLQPLAPARSGSLRRLALLEPADGHAGQPRSAAPS
jgi:hypothetical protein